MDHVKFVLLSALVLGTQALLAFAVSGDPARGKDVYEKQCVFCHGAQGNGDGSLGKSLVRPPANLTKIKAKPDEELLKTIQNGRPPTAIRAFKAQLSEQEIQHALAYIRTFSR